ncbi:Riboflavin transporter MCH5 [Leucoagaricus sp. SymC.cos]|nr:Riboflavin transporter MCH5 [Leucoagaricus sp. SymC.cos]
MTSPSATTEYACSHHPNDALSTVILDQVPIENPEIPIEKSSIEKDALDMSSEDDAQRNSPVDAEKWKQPDDFPDGGLRAWIIVFGFAPAFRALGSSTPGVYAIKDLTTRHNLIALCQVFQAYYQETLLSDFSPSTVAWIGSIQYSLIFFPGLIVGRLFDIGYFEAVFYGSNILLLVAIFLTAQCKEYWHFLLCQGIAVGIASSGMYGCTNAIIAHWFRKKRGQAVGQMSIGTAVGGTVVPISAKKLIPVVGFPWTMRIIGFILLVSCGTSVLVRFKLVVLHYRHLISLRKTLKRRLPPVNIKGGLFNFAVFKDLPYTLYCFASFMIFLGIYTVLTYVSVSARELGIVPDLAFYFVSFSNASSFFGRFTSGVIVDRIGPLNVMIPYAILSGVLTYSWPFTNSEASLIAVVVLYGWCAGAYTCLIANPVMNFGGEGDVGRRVGMFLTVMSLGALAGPPTAGAINVKTGGFVEMGIYAGSCIMLGATCLVLVRYLVLKQWAGRV